jgi:polyisoprenoid-binding protein YceI
MKIKGTSNLHDWESSAYEVRANGTFSLTAGTLKAIQSLYMEIPVKAIKSTKGSMMDNKTYDALKADANPNIIFKLDKVTGLGKRGEFYDINVVGDLTLAGATHKIDMYVQGKVEGNGNLIFNGSKKLKMTDFNINPPTALLGTLTTGNEVEIAFQVTFKPI